MSEVKNNKIILSSAEGHVEGNKLYLDNAYFDGKKLYVGSVGENVNENAGKYTYRQFYLYNQDDEYLNLNEPPMMFLAPEGLGVNLAPEFNDLSQGFFRHVDTGKVPQGNIVGDILFDEVDYVPNTAYNTYREFADFVIEAQQLYLGYIPAKNPLITLEEYRCEVKLDYLTKGQINWSHCLRVPVSLKMVTPWYKTSTVSEIGYLETLYEDINKIDLPVATGHMPAGIKISLANVGANSFSFELKGKKTGKSYGKCVVKAPIDWGAASGYGDVIEYSSAQNDCYIRKVRDGITTDLINKVEIKNNPWFTAPVNEPTELIVYLDRTGVFIADLKIQVLSYYRSV